MALQTTKPGTPYDHRVHTPGGHHLDVHSHADCTGAWLETGADGSLGLISQRGQPPYVQFSEAGAVMPRLVIAVEADGTVFLQSVLPGVGSEFSRVRQVPLEDFEAWVAEKYRPAPQ